MLRVVCIQSEIKYSYAVVWLSLRKDVFISFADLEKVFIVTYTIHK